MAAVLAAGGIVMARQAPVPALAFDSAPGFPQLPDGTYLGEVAGVATDSHGHLFVYTRTGTETVTIGTSRAFSRGGARLFEFDADGRFVREIGQGVYGMNFAQAVRVDRQDNIWIVDAGSNQVIEFDPAGRVRLVLGRKSEALPVPAAPDGGRGRAGGRGGPPGAGIPGDNFNRPTDVAWDAAGNIFVADGYANARVAKFDPQGNFVASVGARGSAQGEFDQPSSLVIDAHDTLYVADRGNRRIEVLDDDLTPKRAIEGLGAPTALCITSGPQQVPVQRRFE